MIEQKEKPKQNTPKAKGLDLRWRLCLALVLTSLLPITLIVAILYNSLFNGTQKIQESRQLDALQRALYSLNEQGNQLDSNVRDYAHWDEMADPATGRDSEWQRINLTEWIPELFLVDTIFLANRDGSIFYDYRLPSELKNNVSSFPPFQKALQGVESHYIFNTENGLLLLATAYVSPAIDKENPFSPLDSQAVLMYGRYLNSSVAQKIGEAVGGDIHFFDKTRLLGTNNVDHATIVGSQEQEMPAPVLYALDNNVPILSEANDFASAHMSLLDVFGNRVGVLSVTVNKLTQNFVREQIRMTIILSLILNLFVASILGLLLGWQISQPIRTLARAINDYTRGDISRTPNVDRSDEIGTLQAAFRDMVWSLEKSKSERARQQETLEETNEQLRRNSRDLQETKHILEERVTQLKQLNEVMVGRELRMAELKKEIKQLAQKKKPKK